MKHIDIELIQKYIDNEAYRGEKAYVEEHLLSCAVCMNAVDEQRKLANEIRGLINNLCDEKIEIPEFKKTTINEKKKRRMILLWCAVATSAACVLAFLFINPEERSSDEHKMLYFNNDYEFDANRTVSQQDIVIKIIDSEGNLSESNI